MARVANCFFALLNLLVMVFGLAVTGVGLYLRVHSEGATACHKVLQDPLLIIGGVCVVVSLVGVIGSCCKLSFVLWIYSFVTFFMVIGAMAFLIFAFVVTNEGAGRALSGIRFKEYRLGDYSNWLRNHFADGKNWDDIKSCLNDAQVCKSLGNDNVDQTAAEFYNTKLSSVQSGCCKPPIYCGFEFKNATFWTMPATGPAVTDPDCKTWSNVQDELCYNCNSCKGGVLANIRKDWRTLAIINACILCFILIIYSASCCARRSIQSRPKFYKGCYV